MPKNTTKKTRKGRMEIKITFPLKGAHTDATKATINADGIEGRIFGGIGVDRLVRTEDSFEASCTVVSKEIEELLTAKPRIGCSVGKLE